MSNKQLQVSKACGALVEHQNVLAQARMKDLLWIKKNPERALSMMLEAISQRKSTQPVLGKAQPCADLDLKPVCAQDVFDQNSVFVSDQAKSLVDWSKPVIPGKLSWQNLDQNANDQKIYQEIGDQRITTPSEVGALLENQIKENGDALLNNGWANIFYVIGKNGKEVAVGVDWYAQDEQWRVFAFSLDGSGWRAGPRVFSRN